MMEFKNAEEKINFLAQYLPAIKEVKDQKTAAAVVDVWLKALEMSPWDSIDQAKFKEGMDRITLISHVNSAVECALAIKYSLQGTTQGRYLTGGVPPVRFSM